MAHVRAESIPPTAAPAVSARAGPATWQCLGHRVDDMGFELSVDWGDAWLRAVEPALRGSVVPEDAEEQPDRPRWAAKTITGGHHDLPIMIETMYAHEQKERYHFSPGFFSIYTDPVPGQEPPTSIRVWPGEQLLRWAGGAGGALRFVADYLQHLGVRFTVLRPVGMTLTADFQIAPEVVWTFLTAHAPADWDQLQCPTWDEFSYRRNNELAVTLSRARPRQIGSHGRTITGGLDGAAAEDVWHVRFFAWQPVFRLLKLDNPGAAVSVHTPAQVWRWLTTEGFSLRLREPRSWEERPLHPWWAAVRDAWNT